MSEHGKTGGPAFPVVEQFNEQRGEYTQYGSEGMTLRDYFAANVNIAEGGMFEKASQALMGSEFPTYEDWASKPFECAQWWVNAEARFRYMLADAMLAARSKT